MAKKQKNEVQRYYVPQPAPLGGEPMTEPPVEQRFHTLPKKQTPRKPARRREEVGTFWRVVCF